MAVEGEIHLRCTGNRSRGRDLEQARPRKGPVLLEEAGSHTAGGKRCARLRHSAAAVNLFTISRFLIANKRRNIPGHRGQSRTEDDAHRVDGTHCTCSVVPVRADRWQHRFPVVRIVQQEAGTAADNSVGSDMAYLFVKY